MNAPNPGSHDAIMLGCICPVLENRRGQFPPFPAGMDVGDETRGVIRLPCDAWHIAINCPVHTLTVELPDTNALNGVPQ